MRKAAEVVAEDVPELGHGSWQTALSSNPGTSSEAFQELSQSVEISKVFTFAEVRSGLVGPAMESMEWKSLDFFINLQVN